jgi:hypothetical protein
MLRYRLCDDRAQPSLANYSPWMKARGLYEIVAESCQNHKSDVVSNQLTDAGREGGRDGGGSDSVVEGYRDTL